MTSTLSEEHKVIAIDKENITCNIHNLVHAIGKCSAQFVY